jgi:hypothetical protein
MIRMSGVKRVGVVEGIDAEVYVHLYDTYIYLI